MPTDDTKIGGANAQFPATRWSAVRAVRSRSPAERQRALEAIVAAYWKPVYKYIRVRWGKSNEDAKDLTQEFFARLIEKDYLGSFDSKKARLRTFLRVCVDRFLANEAKAAKRLKRGGGVPHLAFDFAAADAELKRAKKSLGEGTPEKILDDYFEKEFMRHLFGQSIEQLREYCASRGKELHYRVFVAYDLAEEEHGHPSYEEIARRFGITPADVTNYLSYVRREFRIIALAKLRVMTVTDGEFFHESRVLFGAKRG